MHVHNIYMTVHIISALPDNCVKTELVHRLQLNVYVQIQIHFSYLLG